ncbi:MULTISPECIES: amino acid ABC transporter substrate-binding protein [unclassified Undibacterium]|uniref:amino acid ABC transporter substrate-binding protein n=1 Tax=unclassified Undibacterium TaxID=2630295 RepID=UPI002AC98176|nr:MULTISPECIES: amino acid ABC transporter substrate-binding protein [unclassified Undibacterium]MEB0138972.1 amino acid ABC transporter substrate-binding protein [Undibacterium sp. CCC2.1]MEB0171933.1 amino acid ABC transporter substrate-binding protein [Undibacterium sp. CCC1.1]MEB0175874.1 amino acid ABC transporter substrate-binding protein [Undibacterium sp. CCC3.4]MEB0215060.1 amino acid ABC transporter substrate-binding protein [Undibacterium sp. 5I2]WPX45032.1 amino acid ABC transport
MHRVILCLFFSLLPLLSWSATDSVAKIRKTQTLIIGVRESPPFSFTDSNKQVVGYSVDLCLKIADAVKKELKLPNLKLQFFPVDSTTRFSALQEDKIDLECGSTTNNADRRKRFDFTIPHFFSSVRAVVRSNSQIKNWNQFRNRTIVTTKSTTTVKLLSDRNDINSLGIKLVEGDTDQESFKMIENGKADAFPMDDVLLYSLRADAKDPSAFAIIGEPLSVEPYSIMLRKDDTAFKKIVDTEMLRIIHDGEIYKIYDRWFIRPIPPKGSNLNMPMGFLLRDSLRFPSDQVGN